MARFVYDGYGQIELNNVAFRRDGRIEAQCKLKETTYEEDGTVKELKADTTVVSVGYVPTPVFAKSKHVHVIGDAAQVGSLRTVIWGAWDIGMKL